jgi:hypothetical protein
MSWAVIEVPPCHTARGLRCTSIVSGSLSAISTDFA